MYTVLSIFFLPLLFSTLSPFLSLLSVPSFSFLFHFLSSPFPLFSHLSSLPLLNLSSPSLFLLSLPPSPLPPLSLLFSFLSLSFPSSFSFSLSFPNFLIYSHSHSHLLPFSFSLPKLFPPFLSPLLLFCLSPPSSSLHN